MTFCHFSLFLRRIDDFCRKLYNVAMFNTQHILYMLISGTLTAALLFLANRYVTDDASKNRILKFFAIITVVLHYSNLWVDYFTTGGNATISSNQILPIYPCNVIMWMLLIVALLGNKQRRLFHMLGEFCFIVGSVCGTLGIVLNFNFDNTPTLADYDVLKGMLSHSTMLFGCLYLYFGGYVLIRMFNFVSVIAGLSCQFILQPHVFVQKSTCIKEFLKRHSTHLIPCLQFLVSRILFLNRSFIKFNTVFFQPIKCLNACATFSICQN